MLNVLETQTLSCLPINQMAQKLSSTLLQDSFGSKFDPKADPKEKSGIKDVTKSGTKEKSGTKDDPKGCHKRKHDPKT